MQGRGSVYGGACDHEDNNIPKWAPYDANRTPGIALRDGRTARRFFLLTMVMTGRRVVVWHSDEGPGIRSRIADVNHAAARGLGYSGCAGDFPTDRQIRLTRLKTKTAVRRWVAKTRTSLDDRFILRRL